MNCSGCKSVVNMNSDICMRCRGWAAGKDKKPVLYDFEYPPAIYPQKPDMMLNLSLVVVVWLMGRKKRDFEYRSKHGTITKKEAVLMKGGACIVCGYNRCSRALSFHHVSDKQHNPSSMFLRKLAKPDIISELDKCVLVCNNCHAEIHAGLIDLEECL